MELKAGDITTIARKTVLFDMLIMAAIWGLSLLVVDPRGNFPSNDDWAFGSVVKELVRHGEFHPTGWSSMPMVTNVLWGSLFCLVAGYSFNVLRVSTLVLALGGMLGAYWLAKEFQLPRWLAWLGALLLGFNPIFYALSYTFMTDVPFTTICIFTTIFFFRSLKTGSDRDLAIGVLLAVAATLSRQLGLALPLGFGVALFLREGINLRVILRAVGPVIVCGASLMLYQHWLTDTHQMPPIYNVKTNKLILLAHHLSLLPTILEYTLYSCLPPFGLFLCPIIIFVWPGLWAAHRKEMSVALLISVVLMGAMTVSYVRNNHTPLMPTIGNVLNDTGIGPQMLRDYAILHIDNLHALPWGFWMIVTFISYAGAVGMGAILGVAAVRLIGRVRLGKTGGDDAGSVFLVVAACAYMLPLLLAGYFDRYLIIVMLWMAMAMANTAKSCFSRGKLSAAKVAASGLLFLTLLFAVAGTRDYMTWNRLRWQALDNLTRVQHIDPAQIDGGFEFGGMHFFDFNYTPPADKSYWWVHDDLYVISFGPVPGTSLVKEYDYYNWLPPHRARICVLKRKPRFKDVQNPDKHPGGFLF